MRRSSSRALLLAALLLAACSGGPDQSRSADGLTVGVRTDPSPAELGENGFTFFVKADGKAVADADVTFRMHMPDMEMSSAETWIPTHPEGGGRYTARGDFSMGGDWVVDVAVRPAGGKPVSVTFPYTIKWELK